EAKRKAVLLDGNAAGVFFERGFLGIDKIKPGTEIEGATDAAFGAFEAADDDAAGILFGSALIFRPEHGVAQDELTVVGFPFSLENHRFVFVALATLDHGSRTEPPQTAFAPVEQCAEENVAIIIRQTHPIDGAVGGDKRRSAAIADEAMAFHG